MKMFQFIVIFQLKQFSEESFYLLIDTLFQIIRSSLPKAFIRKDVLKICTKFTAEHPCFAILLKSHFGKGVLP